ncbi:MAG TPA: hypothetical protein VGK17_02720 [Propionicimonas sp.]
MKDADEPRIIDGWLIAPNGRLPGVVNWCGTVDYLADASSFESAATTLVRGWQQLTDDGLIKPILYLHRHAIELHLKAAIEIANKCVADPFVDNDRWLRNPKGGGHSLKRLTERLLNLLARPELGVENLPLGPDGLEGRLLLELDALDPGGDELRYPTRWDAEAQRTVTTRMPGGADTLDASVLIDVERMGADLAHLNAYLGGIHDWLYEERYTQQFAEG